MIALFRQADRSRRPARRVPCLAAVLLLVVVGACHGNPEDAELAGAGDASRGIVLVIVDTLRADHLSCLGYPRPTTPNLDRLAAEGELYRQAWAQAPWTLPAVATILTGRLPQVHGAGRGSAEGRMFPLRDGIPTLAETLRSAGHRTAAFVNVLFLEPKLGLNRGFEVYDYHGSNGSNRGHRDAAATTDAALAWAAKLKREPFFMLVHYFDPHLTYDPPAPMDTMFEPDSEGRVNQGFGSAAQVFALRSGELRLTPRQKTSLIARYDGEIRFVDEQFGRLRRGLEELGLWRRSLVIVVADHGEEFWDHGSFEHGHSHYRELLRVPLIVSRPGAEPAVREQRVRQLDIVPTVLEWAGQPIPDELPGTPLGSHAAPFSVAAGSLWAGELLSIRSADGTLILDGSTGARQFFAADDPAETRSLIDRQPEQARSLEKVLQALRGQRREEDRPWEPTDEQLDQLRALGYLK